MAEEVIKSILSPKAFIMSKKKSVGAIENPSAKFKTTPWVKYKWILKEPIQKGDSASKKNVEKELTRKLFNKSHDYIPAFNWNSNKDGMTWRLKVNLKRVKPPTEGSKSPQPPPP